MSNILRPGHAGEVRFPGSVQQPASTHPNGTEATDFRFEAFCEGVSRIGCLPCPNTSIRPAVHLPHAIGVGTSGYTGLMRTRGNRIEHRQIDHFDLTHGWKCVP